MDAHVGVDCGDAWFDAFTVLDGRHDGTHTLDVGGKELVVALHPWNHALREMAGTEFAAMVERHARAMRAHSIHMLTLSF